MEKKKFIEEQLEKGKSYKIKTFGSEYIEVYIDCIYDGYYDDSISSLKRKLKEENINYISSIVVDENDNEEEVIEFKY